MEITGIKDKMTLGVRRFFLSEEDKRLDKLGILKDVREFERVIKELEREKNRLERKIEAVKNDNSISEKDRYEKLSVLQTDLKKVEGELAAQSQNKRILINYRNDIESLYENPDDKLLENLKFENEIYSKMRNAMQDSLKSYAEKVYLKEEKNAEIKREADSFRQSESLSFNNAYNNLRGVAQPNQNQQPQQQPNQNQQPQPQPKQNQQPQPQPKQNQQPQPQPNQNQQPQPQPSQTNSSLDLTQFGIDGITCMEDFDKITDPNEKLAKLYQLHKAFKEVIGKQIKETKEKIEAEAKEKAEAEAKEKAEAEAKEKAEAEAKAKAEAEAKEKAEAEAKEKAEAETKEKAEAEAKEKAEAEAKEKAEAEAKEKAEAEAKRLAEEAEKEEEEEAKRRKGNEARNKGKKRSRDKNRKDIKDAEITPADVEGAAKTIRTGIDQSQAQEPSQTQEPLQDNDNDRGE